MASSYENASGAKVIIETSYGVKCWKCNGSGTFKVESIYGPTPTINCPRCGGVGSTPEDRGASNAVPQTER